MGKKIGKNTEAKKKSRKKHRGLNFFLSLLIIIAAAGAVFWFGWVQFSLDENEYGVIYTKTNGYETQTLKNGEFAWRWQALLPTNLTLHIFNLETRSFTSEKSGKLPSGDFYAGVTGEDINFDWDIEIRIVYRLNPEALPALVSEGLVTRDLETYYSDFESRMNNELIRLISSEVETSPEETIGTRISRLEESIREKASDVDKRITIIDARVNSWTYPDLALYTEARRLVLDMMNKRQSVLSEVENSALKRNDVQNAKLGLLEEYGRILQEYPVLLDLFSLEGHPGSSLLPPEDF